MSPSPLLLYLSKYSIFSTLVKQLSVTIRLSFTAKEGRRKKELCGSLVDSLSHAELKLLNLFFAGHSFYHSAKTSKLFFKPLISSLNVNNIIYNRNSICRKSCDAKRCTCT